MKPLHPGYKLFCQACGTEVERGIVVTRFAREEMDRIQGGQEYYCKPCDKVIDDIDRAVHAFEEREKKAATESIEARAQALYERLRNERLGSPEPRRGPGRPKKATPGAIPNPSEMN